MFWIQVCSQQRPRHRFQTGMHTPTSGQAVVSSTVLFTRHSSGQLSVLLQGPLLRVSWTISNDFVVLQQHKESCITTFFIISGAASSPKQSSSSPEGYCALSPQINWDHIIPDCQQRQTLNLQQFQYRSLSSQLAVGAWFPF